MAKITLYDAYTCRVTLASGGVVVPAQLSYMSRGECVAWLKATAKAGDKIEIIREMTGETVHTETKGEAP